MNIELVKAFIPLAIEWLSFAALAVAALALLVGVVVEVIKGVSVFKEVPTDIIVVLLSLAFSILALFIAAAFLGFHVMWYYIVGAAVLGFFVAFIAMYGWSKLAALWKRLTPPESK